MDHFKYDKKEEKVIMRRYRGYGQLGIANPLESRLIGPFLLAQEIEGYDTIGEKIVGNFSYDEAEAWLIACKDEISRRGYRLINAWDYLEGSERVAEIHYATPSRETPKEKTKSRLWIMVPVGLGVLVAGGIIIGMVWKRK